MKDFYRQERVGIRKLYQAKSDWVLQSNFSLRDTGVHQIDYLNNADYESPDQSAYDSIFERAKTVINIQFGDMISWHK